jgi:type IV pilus assembly protein PilP
MLPLNSLKMKLEDSKGAPPDANSPLAPLAPGAEAGTQPGGVAAPPTEVGPAPQEPPGYAYHPDSRRDPFLAIVLGDSKATEVNLNVPPLQRVAMSELSLIGVIWGGFGYVAMVQTPDGRGYTVREGTRVGSANGVVSAITPETLTIKEPFSDIYGRKEMREHVMSLHPKSNVE